MKMPSSHIIADEPRSFTPEPNHAANRTPRRSHVSISSTKRPSMNVPTSNGKHNKQGMFRRAVPQMPRALAFVCFAFNLILPGTGRKTLERSRDVETRWVARVHRIYSRYRTVVSWQKAIRLSLICERNKAKDFF